MISQVEAKRTYNLALAHYLKAREAQAPTTSEHHLLALILAAVWVATERVFGDPWRQRVAGPPAMSRQHFLRLAGESYDGWMVYRPPMTFVVLEGGAAHAGDNNGEGE